MSPPWHKRAPGAPATQGSARVSGARARGLRYLTASHTGVAGGEFSHRGESLQTEEGSWMSGGPDLLSAIFWMMGEVKRRW